MTSSQRMSSMKQDGDRGTPSVLYGKLLCLLPAPEFRFRNRPKAQQAPKKQASSMQSVQGLGSKGDKTLMNKGAR
jgi:hypothetical protein